MNQFNKKYLELSKKYNFKPTIICENINFQEIITNFFNACTNGWEALKNWVINLYNQCTDEDSGQKIASAIEIIMNKVLAIGLITESVKHTKNNIINEDTHWYNIFTDTYNSFKNRINGIWNAVVNMFKFTNDTFTVLKSEEEQKLFGHFLLKKSGAKSENEWNNYSKSLNYATLKPLVEEYLSTDRKDIFKEYRAPSSATENILQNNKNNIITESIVGALSIIGYIIFYLLVILLVIYLVKKIVGMGLEILSALRGKSPTEAMKTTLTDISNLEAQVKEKFDAEDKQMINQVIDGIPEFKD